MRRDGYLADTSMTERGPETPPTVRPDRRRNRRLVRNLGSLSAASATTKVLVFVTSILVSRFLGPRNAGRLVTAQTLVMIGSLLADLGLTVLIMGDIVRDPRRISKLVTATALLQAGGAIVMSVTLAALALLAPLPFGTGTLLLLLLPLPLALAFNMAYALQAVEDMNMVALSRLLTVVVTSVGSVALVAVTQSPTGAAVMAWVGVLAGDIAIALSLWRRHQVRPEHVSMAECREMGRRSLPLLQNGTLFILFLIADTLSLALLSTARQVGIYSVAWSMSFAAQTAVLLITDAAYPEMVRRWGESPASLRALGDQLVRLTSRLTFAGAALVVVEAPSLVHLALGPSFSASATVLRILVWIVPLGGVAVLVSFVLVAANEQRTLVRRRAITVALAFAGCPVAAANGGAPAVAWVITSVTVIEWLLLFAATRRICAASLIRPMGGQLDYLIGPLLALLALHFLHAHPALFLSLPVWLIAVSAVEARRRFSTLREIISAYGRQPAP